jgi:hypothetical protein
MVTRRMVLLSMAVVLGMVLVWLVLPEPQDFIDCFDCDRIKLGMNQTTVTALLGPADGGPHCGVGIPEGVTVRYWCGRKTGIEIHFGPGGEVIYVQRFADSPGRGSPFFDRLRAWLRL